jgi:hypothetical protein
MSQPLPFSIKKPDMNSLSVLESRAGELRASLAQFSAADLASRSGVALDGAEIHLRLLDTPVTGTFPGLEFQLLTGEKLPGLQQALLLYYLSTADGVPQEGRWVSFADLPGGRMYNLAFQGYSGNAVRDVVRQDLGSFKTACLALGGQPQEVGSASFYFPALPRVPLLLTCWLGDDDFPTSCQVLFDATATHYLPIDGCAILGSLLTARVVKKIKSLPAESSKDNQP